MIGFVYSLSISPASQPSNASQVAPDTPYTSLLIMYSAESDYS